MWADSFSYCDSNVGVIGVREERSWNGGPDGINGTEHVRSPRSDTGHRRRESGTSQLRLSDQRQQKGMWQLRLWNDHI